jgi:hypothetical protein
MVHSVSDSGSGKKFQIRLRIHNGHESVSRCQRVPIEVMRELMEVVRVLKKVVRVPIEAVGLF